MHKLSLFIILIILSFSTHAGFYKCTTESGKTIFSDKPCKVSKNDTIKQITKVNKSFVKGSFYRNNKVLNIVDGVAFWNKRARLLHVLLTTSRLNDQDRAKLERGDFGWLMNADAPKYVDIEVRLKDSGTGIDAVKHMHTVIVGLGKKPRVPWTSNHSKGQLLEKVKKFNLAKNQVSLKTNEMSRYIRWKISIRLPLIKN